MQDALFVGMVKLVQIQEKIKPNLEILHHTLKVYNEAGGGSFTLSPILGEITAIPNLIEILQDIRTKYKNIKGLSFIQMLYF